MRRFLYISFFFPPLGGAEPRHNLSQIRVLFERGFVPTVLTAPDDIDYSKDEYLLRFVPQEIEVKRFPWPCRQEGYTARARRMARLPRNPLIFTGWRDIYLAAKTEMSGHNYEFVYSVHGIASAHLAALKLKNTTGCKWVAEFRDPWFHNCIIWKYMRDHSWKWWYRREMKRTRLWLEKVLVCADLIVVESPAHGELLTTDFGVSENRVVPYGTGYGEEYFSADTDSLLSFNRTPVIGFFGSTYYGYDHAVKNFILALKELENSGCSFTFVSIGDSSSRFSSFSREIGLQSFVPIERVSFARALALMKAVDLGLVCVGQEYTSNINSKIWEYLKTNLSIVALVPDKGAMAEILREGQCGYVVPYDVRGMVHVLRKVFDDYENNRLLRARPEFVARFSRRQVGVQLAERIEQMLCDR